MGYRLWRRDWPSTKAMYFVMIPELLGTIAALVVFGLAQPDLFRTQLWRAGNELGFNSSPNIILYAYANYRPLPNIPFVWSATLTNFNVAISVISLFMLLAKLIGVIMHAWLPMFALFINISLVALYATSIYGQAGPDYADPNHPSPVAWYIAKPCNVAANYSVQKSCMMAKGTFAMTCIVLAIYLTNLGLTIWALIPNEKDKPGYIDDDDESTSPSSVKNDKSWEMHAIPETPRTAGLPYTPRTMAFKTLDRRLPLRS